MLRCHERLFGQRHSGRVQRRAAHQLLLEAELDACGRRRQGFMILLVDYGSPGLSHSKLKDYIAFQ
jgi:hypothetical protein